MVLQYGRVDEMIERAVGIVLLNEKIVQSFRASISSRSVGSTTIKWAHARNDWSKMCFSIAKETRCQT